MLIQACYLPLPEFCNCICSGFFLAVDSHDADYLAFRCRTLEHDLRRKAGTETGITGKWKIG